MEIESIKTEIDYENALVKLEQIFDVKQGTKEGKELERLFTLIERYEDIHYPIII